MKRSVLLWFFLIRSVIGSLFCVCRLKLQLIAISRMKNDSVFGSSLNWFVKKELERCSLILPFCQSVGTLRLVFIFISLFCKSLLSIQFSFIRLASQYNYSSRCEVFTVLFCRQSEKAIDQQFFYLSFFAKLLRLCPLEKKNIPQGGLSLD